jgi:dihydroorotase
LCCENPAKLFGLQSIGAIRKGFVADLVLVNLQAETEIKNDCLKTKCKWSPFNGWKLKGRIEKVFLAGKEVFG